MRTSLAWAIRELAYSLFMVFLGIMLGLALSIQSALADPAFTTTAPTPRWMSCGVYVTQPAPAMDVCVDYRDGERSCKVALLRDGKVESCPQEAPPLPPPCEPAPHGTDAPGEPIPYLFITPADTSTTEVVQP